MGIVIVPVYLISFYDLKMSVLKQKRTPTENLLV